MAIFWILLTFTFVVAVLGTVGFGIFKMFGGRTCGRQLHTR
jgi:hypothetical protein